MAVVFPAPAGAIASCSRAPEVHIWRTSDACPASSAVPFAAISSRARSTAACVDGRTAATSRRGDEAGLGVEDPLRGVEVGAGDGVDRRPVDPPQHLRFLDAVARRGQGNRSTIEHLIDQQVHQRARLFSGQVDGADLPLRFGPDMPHLPGRPAFLHNGQDVIGRLCDPVGVGDRWRSRRAVPAPSAPSTRRRLRPPSTAAASFSQVVRCSARDRGSCLASRVSNVACCARCNASTGVGGRP